MVDDNGNLIYEKHEMWELSTQYDSLAAVQATFVGIFDDIMVCEENVVFN